MRLSRKFDLFTLAIVAIFIAVFIVSLHTIIALNRGTTELFTVSQGLQQLMLLKNSLTSLQHETEHYLHDISEKRHANMVRRELVVFEQLLEAAKPENLDEGSRQIVSFAAARGAEFSRILEEKILNGNLPLLERKRTYRAWEDEYIRELLDGIDKRWAKELENIEAAYERALRERRKALVILFVTASAMLGIVAASRYVVARMIVRPLRRIEDVSEAISQGDTSRRIEIPNRDELGSLSRSINKMAQSIGERIGTLTSSIAREQAVVREQTILSELMAFIASGVDIGLILQTFVGRTRDLMKAAHGCIFILENWEAAGPRLKLFFNTFEEQTSRQCAEAMLKGVFSDVLRSAVPVRKDRFFGSVPPTHFMVNNMLALSLTSIDQHLTGLIAVVNKEGGFTQEDEDILFSFSFQAFQAITMQEQVLRYATTDGLTGLNNHRVFKEKLCQEMERSTRYGRDLTLLLIDIDHFKSFNDNHGHQAGDEVLRKVAGLIFKNVRNTDIAARYGGEEFAVILPETSGAAALIVAERLRNSIERQTIILGDGATVGVTVSIGYASYPLDAREEELLIKRADEGLYRAKEAGRNRVCRHTVAEEDEHEGKERDLAAILGDSSLAGVIELAKAIDTRARHMRGHSFEVAVLAVRLGRKIGFDDVQIDGLKIASLLHDVGNLSIPETVLNKPGSLTEEEKRIIQGHPGLPELLVQNYPQAEFVLPAILYHHERYDGKGYPRGLKGEEIPLPARLLSIVEAYHAMISSRPYRKSKSEEEALTELSQGAGTQFDPHLVGIFVALLRESRAAAAER